MKNKNLDFNVTPELLELAYQGDAKALLKIGQRALSEKRFGLAQNFFRLAKECGSEQAAKLFKKVS